MNKRMRRKRLKQTLYHVIDKRTYIGMQLAYNDCESTAKHDCGFSITFSNVDIHLVMLLMRLADNAKVRAVRISK